MQDGHARSPARWGKGCIAREGSDARVARLRSPRELQASRPEARGAFLLPGRRPLSSRAAGACQGQRDPSGPLTPRETELVKLIAEDHSSQEIDDLPVISVKTVERHRADILEKLGMRDRVELTPC
jgi:DNA-binding CsgD family transcriptional regulator